MLNISYISKYSIDYKKADICMGINLKSLHVNLNHIY